jgi:hypothetical protein
MTPVPNRGVAGLQSAFLVSRFIEITGSHLTSATPDKKGSHCTVHEGRALELYCETCRELTCYKCIARGGEHHDHDYVELEDSNAFEKHKQEIVPLLEQMEKQESTAPADLPDKQAPTAFNTRADCSICLDTYTNPKLLQCFHTYCEKCLSPLVVRDQQGQLGITCPACHQVTPVADRGVAGLQSAFHIPRSSEIIDPVSTTGEAVPTDEYPAKKVSHCRVHEGKELELYCETCGELLCYKCVLKGGKHHDHDYDEIQHAFERYKMEIMPSLQLIERQVTVFKEALVQQDARCTEISDQRTATAVNIHTTFRRLREALDVRETELIHQLDQTTQDKMNRLATQRDQIETTLVQLNSCLEFTIESLRPGNEEDALMMKTPIVRQIKELATPSQQDTLRPNTEADFSFSAEDMTALCLNYGEIFPPGTHYRQGCRISIDPCLAFPPPFLPHHL